MHIAMLKCVCIVYVKHICIDAMYDMLIAFYT